MYALVFYIKYRYSGILQSDLVLLYVWNLDGIFVSEMKIEIGWFGYVSMYLT